jgi:branched-chain amino acid transport system substrate-binding protein
MRKLSVLLIVLCISLAWAGIRDVQAAAKEPYVIGVPLDLTGPTSLMGKPIEAVIKMRVEEFNKAGGIHGRALRLVILDNESAPAKTVLNTKKLIDVDKAVACLGYTSSGTTLAAVETAESGETVLYSHASSDKIWIPTKKWVFNVVPRTMEACTPMMVDNLIKRGAKKVAYIYIDNAMGQTGLEAFNAHVQKIGIKPAIIEKYEPAATDVSAQITHIKNSGADGLFVDGLAADAALVLKTARELGFKYPINCGYGVVGPEFIRLASKNGEGVLSTSLRALVAKELPDTDPQKKVAVDLYEKYTKNYGDFSLYAGHGWDSISITAQALTKVDPNLDPTKEEDLKKIRSQLRASIEGTKNFLGQNGIFNYSADNHNGLPPGCYLPVVIERGKWVLYKGK